MERDSFSFKKYALAIKGACDAAGIPPFTPDHTVRPEERQPPETTG